MMMFLKMYCPKREKPTGRFEKDCSGNSSSGEKVNNICRSAIEITILEVRLNSNSKPMAVSHMASNTIEMEPGIKPKDNLSMVFFARSSAGLSAGKNFKIPNHK